MEPDDGELEEGLYRLSLTNLEVKRMFRSMIRRWFRNSKTRYNDFLDALLTVRGIAKEQIRHYGCAFEGKKVLIG